MIGAWLFYYPKDSANREGNSTKLDATSENGSSRPRAPEARMIRDGL
jgi:hypothetical protein